MTQTDARPLTKNQRLVFDELNAADGPLTAYTILDQLRDAGLRSPPQVYRSIAGPVRIDVPRLSLSVGT